MMMMTMERKKKTLWQKVYSFFGFWTYCENDRRVVYWCCFPWGHFYRKFDLFSFARSTK